MTAGFCDAIAHLGCVFVNKQTMLPETWMQLYG